MKNFILAVAMLVALSGAAQAGEWVMDAGQSRLTFTGEQSGEKFTGGFKHFTAAIAFDPAHPETGKINVTVDIASATAGSADRDAMLPQSDWFDAAKFPQAVFTSTAIRKIADGSYEAAATLSIKGVTKNVTLPFTLAREGDHYRAHGQLVLMRNDFAVGKGMFASEDYVKYAVTVVVDLSLKPV